MLSITWTYLAAGEGGGMGGGASPGEDLAIRSGVEEEADKGDEPSPDP